MTLKTEHRIAGMRQGRLVLLSRETEGRKRPGWLCQCDCGNTTWVSLGNLSRVRSCGCLQREAAREVGRRSAKHGKHGTPEYRAWRGMISRCELPCTIRFADYGGRGITVCARWRNSFESFYADMGPRPSSDHSLDRYPNNDGNYEPGNVRWATRSEQASNKRNTRVLVAFGESRPLQEWLDDVRCKANEGVLRHRLSIGWSAELALTTPMPKAKRPAGYRRSRKAATHAT